MAFVHVGDGELGRKLGGAPEGDSEVVENWTSGKGALDVEMVVLPWSLICNSISVEGLEVTS